MKNSLPNKKKNLAADFESASSLGAPGFDLMLDYVHPNQAGNMLNAQNLFTTLSTHPALSTHFNSKLFDPSPLPEEPLDSFDEHKDISFNSQLIKLFSLHHQHEAATKKFHHLISLLEAKEITQESKAHERAIAAGKASTQYQNEFVKFLLGGGKDHKLLEREEAELMRYYKKWYLHKGAKISF